MDAMDEPNEIDSMDEPNEIDSSVDGRYLKYDEEIGRGSFKTVWKGEGNYGSWVGEETIKDSLG